MTKLQTFFFVSLLNLNTATTISKPLKFEYQYHQLKNISKGIYNWRHAYSKDGFETWQCGKRWWENFPSINNLNQLLKPFANRNCLINIQNY